MSACRSLRLVSFAEGVSLLLLLLIAMPLKYVWALPLAVRIAGSVHGILFLWLLTALVQAHIEGAWSLWRSLRLLALALVPFGFIVIDRELRDELARSAPQPPR